MHIYCNFIITDFLPNCDCCAAIVRNALIENVFLADSQIIFQHTKTHIAGTMEGHYQTTIALNICALRAAVSSIFTKYYQIIIYNM